MSIGTGYSAGPGFARIPRGRTASLAFDNVQARAPCDAVVVGRAPVTALGSAGPVASTAARARSYGRLVGGNMEVACGACRRAMRNSPQLPGRLAGCSGNYGGRALEVSRARSISRFPVEATSVTDGGAFGGSSPERCVLSRSCWSQKSVTGTPPVFRNGKFAYPADLSGLAGRYFRRRSTGCTQRGCSVAKGLG